MGRAVRVNSQLKSHKRFATAFPRYTHLVDNARLYCTNAPGGPPMVNQSFFFFFFLKKMGNFQIRSRTMSRVPQEYAKFEL